MDTNLETALLGRLAVNVKLMRAHRNLTQDDIANAAGVSLRTYKRIEQGHQWPSHKDALVICAALDVPVTTLMEKEVTQLHKALTNKKFISPLTL